MCRRMLRNISLILLSFIFFGCKGSYNKADSDLIGTYYTVDPSRDESISIMFLRGYFHFVHTRENEDCLKLNENNFFIHQVNYCKTSEAYKGKWSVEKNTLLIDYFDSTQVDLKFTILSDKIYTIRDFTTTIDNKKEILKSLTLMKKR